MKAVATRINRPPLVASGPEGSFEGGYAMTALGRDHPLPAGPRRSAAACPAAIRAARPRQRQRGAAKPTLSPESRCRAGWRATRPVSISPTGRTGLPAPRAPGRQRVRPARSGPPQAGSSQPTDRLWRAEWRRSRLAHRWTFFLYTPSGPRGALLHRTTVAVTGAGQVHAPAAASQAAHSAEGLIHGGWAVH